MDKYVPKITAHLAESRLRPVSEPQWLMRIGGLVQEGCEETSSYGSFVRWRGTFQAAYEAVTLEGEIGHVNVISNALILPDAASEYLVMYFTSQRRDFKREQDDTRTGMFYVPKNDRETVRIALDIMLAPPGGKRPSTTGYVFDYRVLLRDDTINPLAELEAVLKGAAMPPLPLGKRPTLVAPPEAPQEPPPVETKKKSA